MTTIVKSNYSTKMSKLADTAQKTRKYLIYFAIFAVTVIAVQKTYQLISGPDDPVGNRNTAYKPADNAFGPITYPEIPTLTLADGTKATFSISGQFDPSPNSVNIYKVDIPRETLGNVSTAQQLAQNLNITIDYQTVDQTKLVWQTNDKRLLEYNKVSKDVRYINLGLKPADIKPEIINTEEIDRVLNSVVSLFKVTTIPGRSSTKTFLKADNESYLTSTIPEKSDFIREEYFISLEASSLRPQKEGQKETQKTTDAQPINGKIYRANSQEGYLSVIVANRDFDNAQSRVTDTVGNIREFNLKQFTITAGTVGTYNLKTKEEAWQDVKDGKASLRSLVRQGSDPLQAYNPLKVKRFIADPQKSELGYFLPEDWTGYIYPIYIFRGTAELDNGVTANFVFYAKAIE